MQTNSGSVFSESPLHICWCPENCWVSLYTVILYTPVHVKLGGHSEKCYNRVCSVWHSGNDMRQRKWFEMTLLLMLHTPAYANFTHAFVIKCKRKSVTITVFNWWGGGLKLWREVKQKVPKFEDVCGKTKKKTTSTEKSRVLPNAAVSLSIPRWSVLIIVLSNHVQYLTVNKQTWPLHIWCVVLVVHVHRKYLIHDI